MRIEYTGRQTDVPPRLRLLAERKLRKLDKLLHGITHVHVVLESGRRRRAEVTVQARNRSLAASQQGGDLASSLAAVIDKLTRQAQRSVGRQRDGRRRSAPPATRAEAPANGGPRIVRSRRRLAAKPMTLEEAAVEVGGTREGVLVFRDAATERVQVLYRRHDGNLGLIEPEA